MSGFPSQAFNEKTFYTRRTFFTVKNETSHLGGKRQNERPEREVFTI